MFTANEVFFFLLNFSFTNFWKLMKNQDPWRLELIHLKLEKENWLKLSFSEG